MLSDSQKWLWLVGVVAFAYLIYLLAPVLTPFLAAAFLAYLGDPLVDRLEAKKFSRTVAVCIVFSIMSIIVLLVLLILIPLLHEQISLLIKRIPDMFSWLQHTAVPTIAAKLNIDASIINLDVVKESLLENWRNIGSTLGRVFGKIGQSGQVVILWFSYLVLIPVVTFYLLRDWDILVARIKELIPRTYVFKTVQLCRECDDVLAEFLRGQLLLMLAQGLIYTIGLWVVGLEFALLIGMLAGLVSFVPYLGVIVGVVVAGIAAIMQFQELMPVIYVLMVFGVGQMIEGMVLSPWLVGDRIGLHPVAVIFAVMAGGQLFGFFGVLMALPAAAIITVLLRHLHQHYLDSELYKT